jgi:Zn-dependent peptidase ImmA (M78 family)
VIGVNEDHHPNRQRFTIAHELGHFILHRDDSSIFVDKTLTFYRDGQSSQGVYIQEIEANAFAAELLMPEAVIHQYVMNGIDLHEEKRIESIAKELRVSQQALTIRLISLGWD